jgi:hypothetical protein
MVSQVPYSIHATRVRYRNLAPVPSFTLPVLFKKILTILYAIRHSSVIGSAACCVFSGMRINKFSQAVSSQELAARILNPSFPRAFPEPPEYGQSVGHSSHRQIEGLDYFGATQPAEETTGDFFDLVPLPEPGLLVSVGDVSRHGTGASIIMSGLQAFLRALATGRGALPELVQGLNRSICDISPENFYATLFYGRIDLPLRQLTYVSAGHEPALLFHAKSRRLRRLERTGTVLGLTARAVYRQQTVSLEPGDTLVAFTDGVTEATDARGREFHEKGVRRVLEDYPTADAKELSARILEAVEDFGEGGKPADDRTVVVVRAVDATVSRPLAEQSAELAFAAA